MSIKSIQELSNFADSKLWGYLYLGTTLLNIAIMLIFWVVSTIGFIIAFTMPFELASPILSGLLVGLLTFGIVYKILRIQLLKLFGSLLTIEQGIEFEEQDTGQK